MGAVGKVLRWVAVGILSVIVLFAVLFASGEAMADPGGLVGVLVTALWLVPAAVLAVGAWRWPSKAIRVLTVILVALVAVDVWAALGDRAWRSFENDVGPVRAIAAFAFAGTLIPVAVKRTAQAGTMLVIVGAVPIALAQAGAASSSPLAVVSVPILAAGCLLLLSAFLLRRSTPASGRDESPGHHKPAQHEAA